jgi:cellulose synthase/poly-beta-1,6-N-acetylglucosamine synthase-like glycosyltransferase
VNKIIRFDNILYATKYFSWARSGRPYTGEGRNMAFKKEEFFKVNGYINHMNIRSGEDALFVNEAGQRKNTTICYTPESFTYSEPKKTFKEWYLQKRRQAFTTSFFKPFDKFLIRLFNISQFLFIILSIVLAILQFNWMILVPVIVFRYIISWSVIGYSAAKLREKDTVYWYPVIEIILIFTQLNVYFSNLRSKPVHWK